MRISMTILYEDLCHWTPEIANNKDSNKMCYLGAQIVEEDIIPLEQHVLVINSNCQNEFVLKGGHGVLCIGTPDKQILENNCCLLFPESTSMARLLSDIQKVFLKYLLWEESLLKVINNKGSIQDICNLSNEIFENPLIVYDDNLLVIALSNERKGLPDWDYDRESGKRTLPLDILNDFKMDLEFQNTMSTTGTHLYAKHILGCRGLYNNLWIDDCYAGRVCIHELGRTIKQGDYSLLEYLSGIINSVLLKSAFHKSNRIKLVEQSLIDLLENTEISELFFRERLADIGWNKDDKHICIQILIEERDSKTFSAKYTCNRLENTFPFSFVFPYQQSIIMIINLSKNQRKPSELMSELKIFLREGLLRAGISMVSNDFFRLREYYFQTSLAVTVGEKIDPMYWYFHFNDYILPSMFYEMSKNISVDMYCVEGLFSLIKYDQEHETELYTTLKVYLDNNMNIAHTSNKLFIHRTTLMYRLDRITSLINMDLKNPEDRFKILLSYHLLDWKTSVQL